MIVAKYLIKDTPSEIGILAHVIYELGITADEFKKLGLNSLSKKYIALAYRYKRIVNEWKTGNYQKALRIAKQINWDLRENPIGALKSRDFAITSLYNSIENSRVSEYVSDRLERLIMKK